MTIRDRNLARLELRSRVGHRRTPDGALAARTARSSAGDAAGMASPADSEPEGVGRAGVFSGARAVFEGRADRDDVVRDADRIAKDVQRCSIRRGKDLFFDPIRSVEGLDVSGTRTREHIVVAARSDYDPVARDGHRNTEHVSLAIDGVGCHELLFVEPFRSIEAKDEGGAGGVFNQDAVRGCAYDGDIGRDGDRTAEFDVAT